MKNTINLVNLLNKFAVELEGKTTSYNYDGEEYATNANREINKCLNVLHFVNNKESFNKFIKMAIQRGFNNPSDRYCPYLHKNNYNIDVMDNENFIELKEVTLNIEHNIKSIRSFLDAKSKTALTRAIKAYDAEIEDLLNVYVEFLKKHWSGFSITSSHLTIDNFLYGLSSYTIKNQEVIKALAEKKEIAKTVKSNNETNNKKSRSL